MTNSLTLELPAPVYEWLVFKASESGRTPEQMILAWVETAAKHEKDDDSLLQLAGIFEADVTDIAERHDDYIGQQLSLHHG